MSTPAELLRALGREARAGDHNGATEPSIRTYRGRSVEDIIPQIQRELGADAIIVRRRDGLAGGVLGFFQHPYVEIEAMPGAESVDVYDDDRPVGPHDEPVRPQHEPPTPAVAPSRPPAFSAAAAPTPAMTPSNAYVSEQLAALARTAPAEGDFRPPPAQEPSPPAAFVQPAVPVEPAPAPVPTPVPPERPPAPVAPPPPAPEPPPPAAVAPAPLPPAPAAAPSPPARSASETAMHTVDFHELILREESDLRREADVAPTVYREADAPLAEYEEPRRVRAAERRAVAPGSHGRARAGVEKGLRRLGVSSELARELLDGATAHTLALSPRAGLAQAVRTTIAQRIPVAPPLPTRGAAIAVVGAGGSGKTTCCAALLTAYRRGSTLPASFATLTRGAQREDLRLILAPRFVKPTAAGSARALAALRRAKNDGLAVIDSPRVSPSDKAGIRTLALLLGEIAPERIVVALPATLGAEAAAQLLTALRPLGANALAVTHLDETDQIGVAVEAACRFGLAPEYLLEGVSSGGWRLRRVDPPELASRLLP